MFSWQSVVCRSEIFISLRKFLSNHCPAIGPNLWLMWTKFFLLNLLGGQVNTYTRTLLHGESLKRSVPVWGWRWRYEVWCQLSVSCRVSITMAGSKNWSSEVSYLDIQWTSNRFDPSRKFISQTNFLISTFSPDEMIPRPLNYFRQHAKWTRLTSSEEPYLQ